MKLVFHGGRVVQMPQFALERVLLVVVREGGREGGRA